MRDRVVLIALAGLLAAPTLSCGGGVDFEVAVESASPENGPLGGGQTVVITGEGFLEGGAAPSLVLVGDALATGATVLSDTELQITTPPGTEPGSVDVTVFNDHGFATAAGIYTYNALPTITEVSPGLGPLAGGTEVTITGTGFQAGGAGTNLVRFGGVLAAQGDVTVVSDTELTVATPPNETFELVDVSVENANGGAALPRSYNYIDPGLIAMTNAAVFGGGGPEVFFHISLDTGKRTFLSTISGIPNLTRLGALTHIGGGRFIGSNARNLSAESPGKLLAVGLDGIATEIAELPMPRAPGLAFHAGKVYGLLTDRNQNTFSLGHFSVETGDYTELAVPPLNARGLCLASDGTDLWALVRVPELENQYAVFQLDPTTGEPDSEPVLVIGMFDRCRDMTAFGGQLYVSTNIAFVGPTFFGGGGSQGIYRLDPTTGTTELVASGFFHTLASIE